MALSPAIVEVDAAAAVNRAATINPARVFMAILLCMFVCIRRLAGISATCPREKGSLFACAEISMEVLKIP